MAGPSPAIQPNYLEIARKGIPVDDETFNALQAATRPSVPTGVEGDTRSEIQRYSDAYAKPDPRDRLDRSLLRYGNNVLIPPVEELPGAALDALNRAGEITLAYGPPNLGPAGPVAEAIGMALKAPRALFPASRAADIAASPGETAALAAEGDRAARAVAARNAAGAARRDAAYAEAHPDLGPTVPQIDGYTPIKERNAVLDFLQNNPYVQPIKGRQGMPTKQAQIDLANQFFGRGGRLPEAGPWGRDMPESVRSVLRDAIKTSNEETQALTDRLRAANAEDIPALQEQLRLVRGRADRYMDQWLALKNGADDSAPVNPPARLPPRIYRRGTE